MSAARQEVQQQSRVVLTLGFVLCLFVILLSGCTASSSIDQNKRTPVAVANPPIYPGAQNLYAPNNGFGITSPERVITFETSDKADKVLEYYTDVMLKDGWEASQWSDKPSNVDAYVWSNGAIYSLTVTADEVSTKLTEVELRLLVSYPE